MAKNVQISENLFLTMVSYVIDHQDPQDERYKYIHTEVVIKIHALASRQMYTQYKTALTEEDRLQALDRYLKHSGRRGFQESGERHRVY